MKKLIFGLLCGAMLCALPFAFKAKENSAAYAVSSNQEEVISSEKWYKDDVKEVLGYVGAGIGGVGTALITYLPIYITMKKAKKKIDEATDGVSSENKNNTNLIKRIEKVEEGLESHNIAIEEIHKATKNTEKMCRMAFENDNELVSKGIANEISKVGNEDEEHKM